MAAYPQRSDLRTAIPKQAAKGQPYGEAGKQLKAQEAVPMGASPTATPPEPGSRGPLTRPTERPDEPITAGMPIGPGAGPAANPVFPMAPPAPGSPQAIAETLRAITAIAPNANLIAVLRGIERQAGGRQAIGGPGASVPGAAEGLQHAAGQTMGRLTGRGAREERARSAGALPQINDAGA